MYGATPPLNAAERIDDWPESTAGGALVSALTMSAGLTPTRSVTEIDVEEGVTAEESVTR